MTTGNRSVIPVFLPLIRTQLRIGHMFGSTTVITTWLSQTIFNAGHSKCLEGGGGVENPQDIGLQPAPRKIAPQ
jgi:hypothetical protein